MQSKAPSATNDHIMQALKEIQKTQACVLEDIRHVRAGQATMMARLDTIQTEKLPSNPVQHAENSITTSKTANKAYESALADMKEAEEDTSERMRRTEEQPDRAI